VLPRRLACLHARELPGGLRLLEARDLRARLLGLALLRELPRGCALLIPRCRSVHTFGMRFAIDVVFLDEEGAVVLVTEGMRPRALRSCRRAAAVIEARAGEGRRFADAVASEGRIVRRSGPPGAAA
jgi:hypothetical protein